MPEMHKGNSLCAAEKWMAVVRLSRPVELLRIAAISERRGSLRQRAIRREEEGFADGFDGFGAPGPGLVGGELDLAAEAGEGGDGQGDFFEEGGGVVLLAGLGGAAAVELGDGVGEGLDLFVGPDAGEGVLGRFAGVAGAEAVADGAAGEEDEVEGLGGEGFADVIVFALGRFVAVVFALGGGLDGGEGGEDGVLAVGLGLCGFLAAGAQGAEGADVPGGLSGQGVDLGGERGVHFGLGEAGGVARVAGGPGGFF